MPSTTETTNLGLTIYQSEDKPTYLVDYNNDMQKIDTAYGEIKTAAESADAKATSAGNLAQAASEAVGTAVDKANCAMSAASSVAGTADSALTKAEGAVTLATSASNQAQTSTEKINQVEAGLINIDDITFTPPYGWNQYGTVQYAKVVNGVFSFGYRFNSTTPGDFTGRFNYNVNGNATMRGINTQSSIDSTKTFVIENGIVPVVVQNTNVVVIQGCIPWDTSWTKKT